MQVYTDSLLLNQIVEICHKKLQTIGVGFETDLELLDLGPVHFRPFRNLKVYRFVLVETMKAIDVAPC